MTFEFQKYWALTKTHIPIQKTIKAAIGGALKNFVKFTGKQLYRGLFIDKVPDLHPATLLIKILQRSRFPVNFAKFLGTPIL